MHPSDAGGFQLQQVLLDLALTGMEFSLQRPLTALNTSGSNHSGALDHLISISRDLH